jgi:MYXO-CTERM domain-containing protein
MRRTKLFLAATLLALPTPLMAQDAAGTGDATEQRDDDDGNPRTGLLGLLGLLGLFGLMRREPNIHVDARRRGAGVDRPTSDEPGPRA